ncbi:unnamed protein product, partial [Laminaria digitata]
MADTLKSKEKDPKLVFNVDQEAGADGYDRGAEDGVDEEDDDDAEEEEEGDEELVAEREEDDEDEEEEEDNEPPPPMNESSGSDCDPSPTSRKVGDKGPPATKKGAGASAGAAGGGGKGSGASNGADKKAFKPTASQKMKPQPGTGEVPESPLWTSFVNSRKGSDGDQLGVVPLKMWESFEKNKCIPRAMKAWYANKVQRGRSVPRALMVPQLATGFPEFCHWVAEGRHGSCGKGGRLSPGFEPLALDLVDKVKLKGRVGRAAPAHAPAAEVRGVGRWYGFGGRYVVRYVTVRGTIRGTAYCTVVYSYGICDRAARKKGRRLRKGGAMANGTGFAEKMQSALAGLAGGGTDDDDDDGGDAAEKKGGAAAAAAAAAKAAEAEAEDFRALREEGAGDEELDDERVLGPDFADLRVSHTTRVMVGSLKRAKALRRRSDRQSELLEIELERSLARLAGMETQYRSLVAETSGRECTLAGAISRARPLIEEGFAHVNGGASELALGVYSDAIKLLEVHVGLFVGDAGKEEDKDHRDVRKMLGVALHNRSVANFRLGNAYNGQRDARQATAILPGEPCVEHHKRSQEWYQ